MIQRWHTHPDRPLSKVFVHYRNNPGPRMYGESVWIENQVADMLIQSLKKPAKRAAGTFSVYVVRCKPKSTSSNMEPNPIQCPR